ncbi:MAG: PspC domain-containing protein [Pseudomonadota bacterium]
MNRRSHPDGWVGGVCAELADRLEFSRLGVRVVTVVLLLIWPLWTIIAYLVGAFALRPEAPPVPAASDRKDRSKEPLDPVLRDWDRRMADFDRRSGL